MTLQAKMALAAVLMAAAPAFAQPAGHGGAGLPDLQTLAALKRSGADLAKPHAPVYYLLFATEAAAKSARRAAEADGFGTLKTLQARDGQSWILILTRTMTLTVDNVASASRALAAIAAQYDGRYDGWQAQPRR